MTSDWQPIESAPKDGQPVLIAAMGDWSCEARFIENEGWYAANNDPSDSHGGQLYPTHWQEVPPPSLSRQQSRLSSLVKRYKRTNAELRRMLREKDQENINLRRQVNTLRAVLLPASHNP